jgi:hypothetical protein
MPSDKREHKDAGALRVERAIVELRRGRAVDVRDASGSTTLLAV